MTSQKFSSNKQASKHDLTFAFKVNIVPFFLMLAWCIFEFVYETFTSLKSTLTSVYDYSYYSLSQQQIKITDIASCMLTGEYDYAIIRLFLILSGALFALFTFSFIMKKRNVNFCFATSVNRATLFRNRIIAPMVYMALALFVSIGVDTIINCAYLPNYAYIIKMALALFAQCYLYAVLGFAIFGFAMCCMYTIVEGFLFGCGLYLLPTAIVVAIDSICQIFLKSYSVSNSLLALLGESYSSENFVADSLLVKTANFNPAYFSKNFGARYFSDDIIKLCCNYNYDKKLDYTLPDIGYIAPMLIWAVVFVLIIVAGRYAFIHRKAENTSLHGRNIFATAIFACECAVGVGIVALYGLNVGVGVHIKTPLILIALFLIIAVLYLIVVSIIRRKAIHKAKTYITSIAISFVVVAVSGVLALGGFGYSTYVPDVDDVEMATISGLPVSPVYNALPNDISMDVFSADSYNSAKGMGIFTDEDDIEAFVNVANGLVADSDNEADCDIRVMYRLKNGKTVYRYYSSAGADSIYNVLSLTDTKAYNDELEYLLCGNDEDSELKKNIEKFDLDDSDYFDYSYEISGEKNAKKSIQGGYVGLEYSDGAYKSIDNTYELREALAKDFKASTYNDKFKNENQPICELKFSPNYDDDSDDVYFYGSTVSYHIYPTMTNTVNYLKSINAYKDSTLLAKYDVESAYVTKMSSAIDEYGYNLNTGLYFGGYISCDFSEDIDYTYFYDEIKRVYGEDGKTQDADTIKKYLSVAKPFGYVNGDDYAVVFIVKNSDGIEDFIPMFISQKDME